VGILEHSPLPGTLIFWLATVLHKFTFPDIVQRCKLQRKRVGVYLVIIEITYLHYKH